MQCLNWECRSGFCFKDIYFINIKIFRINKDVMIIIIKIYFCRVAIVVKITFITIRSNNYISKEIPWLGNIRLHFFPSVYLLWKLESQTWHEIAFCFFQNIILSQNSHFRTVKPDMIKKSSRKLQPCRHNREFAKKLN